MPATLEITNTERQTANTWYKALRAWTTHTKRESYGPPAQANTGFTIIGATPFRQPGTGTIRITYLQTPTGDLEEAIVIKTIQNAPIGMRYTLNAFRYTTHPKAFPAALLRPDTNAWTDSIHDIPAIARAVLWLKTELEKHADDF